MMMFWFSRLWTHLTVLKLFPKVMVKILHRRLLNLNVPILVVVLMNVGAEKRPRALDQVFRAVQATSRLPRQRMELHLIFRMTVTAIITLFTIVDVDIQISVRMLLV